MNKLSTKERAQIIGMMVEGMSIRSISRMTGASKNTIVKLLVEAGDAFSDYQNRTLRSLPCKRIQCDEIWAFVYAKDKNAPAEMKELGEAGDVWTWTAIDADTKLMVSWMVGDRSKDTARVFMRDVCERLSNRVQLTTDGYKAYLRAVDDAFFGDIDYAMLQKIYGSSFNAKDPSRRYSPGECTGTIKGTVSGCPDEAHISTSYVERANLGMRMGMRRFTRLTNAFSKKVENHAAAISIYFMHYNFGRIRQTLRVTPAMEAGIAKSPMSFEDMVGIIDAAKPAPTKRGPYKKKVGAVA
ncbi:DDE-type integrase/transposase/recombinase [Nevskia soli]|uniref:DDE-type integrase/transposase/recombinase n=1 Tax=Nevskia soli TaxID=418856 RepID=UPI0004A7253F|nr:DDE-type integrase/transposase/recombinase [Nevskia soli]